MTDAQPPVHEYKVAEPAVSHKLPGMNGTPQSARAIVDHRAGKDEHGYYIRTFTGKKLYWDHVDWHEFDILDIAHALSQRVRWTGHVKRIGGNFITIGQHSCHVHDLLPPPLRKQGLLHDGAEAYMPDFSSPLKWWMISRGDTALRDLEKTVDAGIGIKLNVPYPRHPLVKEADLVMLATENRDFMPFGEERAYMPRPLVTTLIPWGADRTEAEFLERWNAIVSGEQ